MTNVIPDDLRNSPIGANFVTITAAGQVLAPGGQLVEQNALDQMASDFESIVQSDLAAQLLDFNPSVFMDNSPKSVSSEQGVTEHFDVASLLGDPNNLPPITLQVMDLSDANEPPSWYDVIIDPALAGAQQNLFVDTENNEKNLIEITEADLARPGGIRAWDGHDQIRGTNDSDTANGNEGKDHIFGYGGNDLLLGGTGDDYIAGGEGKDILVGEAGSDVLIGNVGDDMLIANALSGEDKGDFLIGSEGADRFILRSNTLTNDAAYAHRIADFNPDEGDTIKIADFLGTNQISFASVDVNLDGYADTALVCSEGVIGVIMSKEPSQITPTSSIFMLTPQNSTLTKISDFSSLSSDYLSNPNPVSGV
jgi:hypothetical protein